MPPELAVSVILPFVIALVVALVTTRTGIMRCSTGALALGAAASVGYAAALGAPSTTLDGWLVSLAPLALVLGTAERASDRPLLTWALRSLLAGAVGVAMLWPKLGQWEAGALIGALHVVGGAVLFSGVLLDGAADRRPVWALADLMAYASLVSATMVAAGSARLGLLVASVAAPLGALFGLRIIDPSERTDRLARAAPSVLAALLGAFVVRMTLYNDPPLPVASIVLLLLAPGAARLVDLARPRLGRAADPLGLALVIVLTAAAAGLAAPIPETGAELGEDLHPY